MKKNINIYFDKECPFCNYYAEYNLLKNRHNLFLYNAREVPQKTRLFREKGFDIDEGIIVEIDGVILQGSEAIINLNKLSSKKIILLDTKFFKYFIYPIMKIFRKVLLFLLRKDFHIK
ncbi:MAG: hypothetical protein C0625_04705 [Arcobacter sp.]|nr:MAG: hypothetical protein C0625_04705 [Arcobacter sp.]